MTGPSRPARAPWRAPALPIALLLILAAGLPAQAALDINDRGPALRAGRFNLRVSNVGVLGNPFPERSFDPSFEYPKGSGTELIQYAALWVGAIGEDGEPHVSGGPNLEWRPTPAEDDTVRESWHGQIGSIRSVDDDGDGLLDEDRFDGKDNDGDGEVDEDFGAVGQQTLAADYVDDRPEAAAFYYGGEPHRPHGLSVHQEAYAWSYPGYEGIAGLQFTITNHGTTTLRDAYVGLYVDFDVRSRETQGGLGDDALARLSYSQSIPRGTSRIFVDGSGLITLNCLERYQRTLPIVIGRESHAVLPVVTVLPLDHTHDPLAYMRPAVAWGPVRNTFRTSVFATNRAAGGGGPPRLDHERYAALKGDWPQAPDDIRDEPLMLVSCGPYPSIAPGQTIEFAVALVAAPIADSLRVFLGRTAFLYSGVQLNRVPDYTGPDANWWIYGESGINGHEVCVEAPEGVTFIHDPDCGIKFSGRPAGSDPPGPREKVYRHGTCIWTDADCDECTGLNGNETTIRWVDPAKVPPSPDYRVTAGDRTVRIEWDNLPEILIAAGKAGPTENNTFTPTRFLGYKIYKLADWRNRSSVLPPEDNWALVRYYGYDARDSKEPIGAITDSTLDYTRIWFERPHYPVGRYAFTDSQVFDGFDYLYVVTTVAEVQISFAGVPLFHRYESPIAVTFDQRVRPRLEAKADAQTVWVVPNPFRASAQWDRPSVYGDRITRHLDFLGLPRARCTIRVWTVAGDHVATIDHDGSGGAGQASWDLVSRNGQEVASGIYLFTVESALGNATGRFVVIR